MYNLGWTITLTFTGICLHYEVLIQHRMVQKHTFKVYYTKTHSHLRATTAEWSRDVNKQRYVPTKHRLHPTDYIPWWSVLPLWSVLPPLPLGVLGGAPSGYAPSGESGGKTPWSWKLCSIWSSGGGAKFDTRRRFVFTAQCTIVQSAVLLSHVVCLSIRLSICDVGGSWPHRSKILETNCGSN